MLDELRKSIIHFGCNQEKCEILKARLAALGYEVSSIRPWWEYVVIHGRNEYVDISDCGIEYWNDYKEIEIKWPEGL